MRSLSVVKANFVYPIIVDPSAKDWCIREYYSSLYTFFMSKQCLSVFDKIKISRTFYTAKVKVIKVNSQTLERQ